MLYEGKKNIWRANDANNKKEDDYCLPAPSLLETPYDYCQDLHDAYQQKYSHEPASKIRISGSIEDEKIFLSQNARRKTDINSPCAHDHYAKGQDSGSCACEYRPRQFEGHKRTADTCKEGYSTEDSMEDKPDRKESTAFRWSHVVLLTVHSD